MSDDGEKSIRILQFSGKSEDWLMQADKFMARATIRGYDEILMGSVLATGVQDENGDPKELSKVEKPGMGISTVELLKEQVRSSYKRLVKKMNLKYNELALTTEVGKSKP